jgi:hypothetical protein
LEAYSSEKIDAYYCLGDTVGYGGSPNECLEWLKSLPYQIKLDSIGVQLCHGSPVRLEEFEYIFAPEQARECLGMYADLGHITRLGQGGQGRALTTRPGRSRPGAALHAELSELIRRLGKRWFLVRDVHHTGKALRA